MNCVHYPYARTNGASHRREVVNARVNVLFRQKDDRHTTRNINTPTLLVTIL